MEFIIKSNYINQTAMKNFTPIVVLKILTFSMIMFTEVSIILEEANFRISFPYITFP